MKPRYVAEARVCINYIAAHSSTFTLINSARQIALCVRAVMRESFRSRRASVILWDRTPFRKRMRVHVSYYVNGSRYVSRAFLPNEKHHRSSEVKAARLTRLHVKILYMNFLITKKNKKVRGYF